MLILFLMLILAGICNTYPSTEGGFIPKIFGLNISFYFVDLATLLFYLVYVS